MATAFEDLRVVDLSDRLSGAYAARMFGDFGADVVLAEPTDGHPLRREPPFRHGGAGSEHSLLHAYANWNKRSIVIADEEDLARLLAGADVVVTTGASQVAVPPSAIHLSITPNGLTGPLAATPGNDLTACARTGWCHMNRYVEEPPLQLPVRQTGYIAGIAGFVVAAAALFRRGHTGEGEQIDVSETEALTHTAAPWATLAIFVGGDRISFGPTGRRHRGGPSPLWQTADGLINFGYGDWPRWREALEFLGQPELANDSRYQPRFGRHQQDRAPILKALSEATATRGKWDLFHGLADVHCIAGVVQNTEELLANAQLNAREFFVRTNVAGADLSAPGPPAKLDVTPWSLSKAAPGLDEHGDEIRAEARTSRVAAPTRPQRRALPLEGIRVLTFTQAWSGPFGTELLAFLGADVVQIEARHRPDVWRGAGAPVGSAVRDPAREQDPLNTNGMYNTANLNKRAITLDMRQPRGSEIFWEMVPAFDIVADNFSPHVMPSWGITLDTLREKRPDIIFASISGYGTEGPLAEYPANGATTEPMAGLASIHGYRGDAGMNTGGLIPDPISGYQFAAAVLAALNHRERTGEGQRIDVAMIEAVAVQLGDAVLEYDASSVIRRPNGNRHPRIAPHGVFATRDDQWLAIAAETDAAWARLADHMDMPDLARDSRFATMSARKRHEDELDDIISKWCALQEADAAESALGATGICAARIWPMCDVYTDPGEHFRKREFLVPVTHPESGTHFMPVAPWKLAQTDAAPVRYAPRFGEHSREVFAQEIGISDAEYEALERVGITGTTRIP